MPVAYPSRPSPTISTTRLLHPSSTYPSYSGGQTARTSTSYDRHQNLYHSNRSPSHAGHSHRASSASTHAQPSYLQPPNSTYAQPSYWQPPSSSRIPQAAAKAKATREHSSTRVIPFSLSRVPNAQSSVEFEAATTAEDINFATALRDRALRSKRAMRAARGLAKSARKRGDHAAAAKYKRDAISHESEMKSLDKRAAKIIFREKNKVRGRLSPPKSCSTTVMPGSYERNI